MTLEVYELGARRTSTTLETQQTNPDLIAFDIWMAVRKSKALSSRNFDVVWNAETNEGAIVVGSVRIVGKVRRLP